MTWKRRNRHNGYVPPPPESPPPSRPVEYLKPAPEVPPSEKYPDYSHLIETRYKDVELTKGESGHLIGEDVWYWIKGDHGAWDGPDTDWRKYHRHKYFKHLKKRGVVITAGANHGMYVRFYARFFRMVYAFEPDPLNFFAFNLNCQLDNVVKLNAALGERNGFCNVIRNTRENTGSWKVDPTGDMIPMFAIDSMNFSEVDFLQLDIEGFEVNALHGAEHTIRRCRPVIAVENGNRDGVRNFMQSVGYWFADQSCADTIYVPEKPESPK